MGVNWSEFTAALVNFLILYLILKKKLFGKVNKIIDDRQDKIASSLEKTKEDLKKAEELRLENEEILKNVKVESKKIMEEQKEKAEKLYDEIVTDAHNEAEVIMERAKTEIEREREKAKDEIKTQAIDIALLLSERALEESIDEKKHREIIDNFIAKVGI